MRKDPKGLSAAKVRKIIRHYETQTDEDAAREIETAPIVEDSTWLRIPTELVPKVRKLIARKRKTA